MTILRTPRAVLRRAREDDLDALHSVISDPRAMRYWSTPLLVDHVLPAVGYRQWVLSFQGPWATTSHGSRGSVPASLSR